VELVTGVFFKRHTENLNEMWVLLVHMSFADSYVYKLVRQKEVLTS
jgi:hypothetical protein